MPSRRTWFALALVAALTFYFPGSTYLQSDTQIYVPMMERLLDSSLYRHDLIAQYPHVRYTVYDDVSMALRRVTGAEFRWVLGAQGAVFRFAGVTGVYLMASAAGLAVAPALFATSVIALGATIVGPAVLTIEYEPVPRGFSLGAGLLMMGLASHGRFRAAGVAGALGFLYHAPTVAPIWGIYFLVALRRGSKMWGAFLPLGVAAVALWVSAQFDPSRQPLFTHVSERLEVLQRTRTSYNWISIWGRLWLPHWMLLFAFGAAAFWRSRASLEGVLRAYAMGLPVYAAAMLPLSYALLEGAGWSAVPQFQPMRALALATVMASLLGLVAAARAGHWVEAAAWLAVPYLIPANASLWPVTETKRVILVLGLAAAAGAGLVLWRSYRVAGAAVLAVAALSAVAAIPNCGGIVNYPKLHSAELDALSEWARANTEKDAVFLFPYAAKRLEPGVFRAEARRAVYVDWKTGGQVNYFPEMAFEWWRRWQDLMVQPAVDLEALAARGIGFVVTDPGHALADRAAVYRNRSYVVYATAQR